MGHCSLTERFKSCNRYKVNHIAFCSHKNTLNELFSERVLANKKFDSKDHTNNEKPSFEYSYCL